MAPLASEVTPLEFLRLSGHHVTKVISVWSASESDLGCETILYLDGTNKPRTATIINKKLTTRAGW